MKEVHSIKPTCATALPKAPSGWFDLDRLITVDDSVAVLRSDADLRRACRDRSELADASRALGMLGLFDGKSESATIRFPLGDAFPVFDRAPNGNWIVASPRCETGALNARLLSPGGDLVRKMALGDAIGSLQFDKGGGLWVGYIDEGVFGNDIGSAGLAKFDVATGEIVFNYNASGEGLIQDCYALNAGDVVFASYYGATRTYAGPSPYARWVKTDHRMAAPGDDVSTSPRGEWSSGFPIVRIGRSGDKRLWWTPVSGPHVVAANATHAVFVGRYAPDSCSEEEDWREFRSRLTLLRFEEEGALELGHAVFDLAAGQNSKPRSTQARGDQIHILTDDMWFRLSVADVARAMGE